MSNTNINNISQSGVCDSNLNKNNMSLEKLKIMENAIQSTASWFVDEVLKFEEESKVLETSNCDYETSERIYNKAQYFQGKRAFELRTLWNFQKIKETYIFSNLLSGINQLKI